MKKKQKYLKFLNKNGIETRPIISGNFLNQPVAKLYKLNQKQEYFKNAEEIDKRGFFIGLHANKIDDKMVKFLTNKLLMIRQIMKRKTALITGVTGQDGSHLDRFFNQERL